MVAHRGDPLILAIFLLQGVTTCLILPLQEGGISKPWSAPSVIAELVVFGVLVLVFVGWEWRMGKRAILPMHLFARRSVVGACIASFFLMMVMLSGTYYLPLLQRSFTLPPLKETEDDVS